MWMMKCPNFNCGLIYYKYAEKQLQIPEGEIQREVFKEKNGGSSDLPCDFSPRTNFCLCW